MLLSLRKSSNLLIRALTNWLPKLIMPKIQQRVNMAGESSSSTQHDYFYACDKAPRIPDESVIWRAPSATRRNAHKLGRPVSTSSTIRHQVTKSQPLSVGIFFLPDQTFPP